MAERRMRQAMDNNSQLVSDDTSYSDESARSSHHRVLLLIAVALLVGCGICSHIYFLDTSNGQSGDEETKPVPYFSSEHLFTKEELRLFDGSDERKPLLLAIVGKVFDVSAGKRHYGKNADYNGFIGRDGTRAFITGEFNDEGLIDDVSNLTDLSGIESWLEFYEKDYIYVGKVIGRYYDSEGQSTVHLRHFHETVKKEKEAEAKQQEENEKYRKFFPPCGIEAGTNIRHRVWCQTGGAFHHDWVGVPRQFFQPGKNRPRCACVRTTGPPSEGPDLRTDRGNLDSPFIKPYTGCEQTAHQCYPVKGEP